MAQLKAAAFRRAVAYQGIFCPEFERAKRGERTKRVLRFVLRKGDLTAGIGYYVHFLYKLARSPEVLIR